MSNVGKVSDGMLDKISELVAQREDLIRQLVSKETELELYRTFVTKASLDTDHV